VAECSVKIRDITDSENVNKLFEEQILIFWKFEINICFLRMHF
jgi:hypothetical protein